MVLFDAWPMLRMEYGLFFGIWFFYLLDGCRLCWGNEWLLQAKRSGWRYVWPSSFFSLGGKRLHVAWPWLAHRLTLTCVWHPSHIDVPPLAVMEQVRVQHVLRPLSWVTALLAMLVLIFLPVSLLVPTWRWYSLFFLLLIYGLIVAMLGWLYIHAGILNLSRKQWLRFVVDGLFCPPYAVHFMRRIGKHQSHTSNGLAQTRYLLNDASWLAFCYELKQRIDTECMMRDEEDPRRIMLEQWWPVFLENQAHWPVHRHSKV